MPQEIVQEQTETALNSQLEDKLVKYITDTYTQGIKDLQPHIDSYNELVKHIFIDTTSEDVKNEKAYTMPGILKRFLTYNAHMISSIYPSPEASFDVQGEDYKSSKSVSKQKALIVKELKNMDYYQILNQYLFYRALKGEVIRYITWEKRTKKVRRKVSFLEKQFNAILSAIGLAEDNKEKFKTIEVPAFEGAKITPIDPHHFVFDKNQKHDWPNCPKIYETISTYEEIKQNKSYSNYEELESLEKQSGNETESNNITQDDNISARSGKIVLLHFWGSLKLDDGTVLNDYYIVLAGGRKIIRFEPNPYPFCPIRRSSFLDNPKTGRSISMFDCAVPLNIYNSEIYQDAQKCAGLVVDKPCVGPEGLLKNKEIKITRGKFIGLKKDITNENLKLEFLEYAPALMAIINLLPLTNQEIESATGIFDNMIGADAKGGRTATEMSMVGTGQEKRMLNEVKDVTRELIIKDIEEIAELNAGYRTEPVPVRASKIAGGFDFQTVNEEDWLGNYSYSYGDSLSALERKTKLNENMSVLKEFLMLPPIQAELGGGMLELLKWLLEQIGMDNADQLIESMKQQTQEKMLGQSGIQSQTEGVGIQGINQNGGVGIPPGAMQPENTRFYPQGF